MTFDRRTLLQSLASLPAAAAAPDLAPAPLPVSPTLEQLASDPLTHGGHEMFSPPGLQNEWGHASATNSICGITTISLPPFGCCGKARMPWAPDDIITGELMLNGRVAYGRVTFQWFPHCVVRRMTAGGIAITARAFMPARRRAVAQIVTLRNTSTSKRGITAGFVARAYVAAAPTDKPYPNWIPGDSEDNATPVPAKGCVLFKAKDSRAFSVQGVSPAAREIRDSRALIVPLELGPGESVDLHFAAVVGDDEARTLADYEDLQRHFVEVWGETEKDVARRVRAAFTPSNGVYSGNLPALHTRSRALWKLYHTGFTNLFYTRVDSPVSAIGPTYITLAPKIVQSFVYLWDTMLTSFSLSLLDPAVVRKLIEIWCAQDLTRSFGTDYVTGRGVGPWYAVNDLALLRCADNYLRLTGDLALLDQRIAGRTLLDHLKAHALRWKQLDKRGAGLGDYGSTHNLLEVVSTYSHEVAALNAGNVYGMRFVASLLERKGLEADAREMRAEAGELAKRIVRLLYVAGKGYWRCGQPDGSYNEVRHAYDFLTVLDCMQPDLPPEIVREMCQFFWRELHSPTWMHALSPHDTDSTWSKRADHAWLGAYTAWPSMSAKALLRADDPQRVAGWIRGLARTANQGPFGQAHVVESAAPPENGGARKCPPEKPWQNHWCEVSGGSFIDLILEDVFGVRPGFEGPPGVRSRMAAFDAGARLEHFRCHGALYRIDGRGANREG
jgi:hypothetical protein